MQKSFFICQLKPFELKGIHASLCGNLSTYFLNTPRSLLLLHQSFRLFYIFKMYVLHVLYRSGIMAVQPKLA